MGRLDSEKPLAIRLSGENISEEHCYFENIDGKVNLYGLPGGSTVRLDIIHFIRGNLKHISL